MCMKFKPCEKILLRSGDLSLSSYYFLDSPVPTAYYINFDHVSCPAIYDLKRAIALYNYVLKHNIFGFRGGRRL